MSYRLTRARKDFESQIDSAAGECRPLHAAGTRYGNGAGARLLGVYYVFAFAQLEVYVKRLVEDSISAVRASNPPFERWPDAMVAYLLHNGDSLGNEYRQFGYNDNEALILEKVAKTARKIAIWGKGGVLPVNVHAQSFLDKKKYPSPRNLPRLFGRLGVSQLWDNVSRTGRINSKLILTSPNDLRTDIAHEGRVPATFGLADFQERVIQMRKFVAAVDRSISAHFCPAVMTRREWNAAMT